MHYKCLCVSTLSVTSLTAVKTNKLFSAWPKDAYIMPIKHAPVPADSSQSQSSSVSIVTRLWAV